MAYYLNLFSPETWQAFQDAGCEVTGFSLAQRAQAEQTLKRGDFFLCYLVRLGRWCGLLEIDSEAFFDETPLFMHSNDPFVIRLKVKPHVVLQPEYALPVRDERIWQTLSWTKNVAPGTAGWGANFQRSLRGMIDEDAEFLVDLLNAQKQAPELHALTAKDLRAIAKAASVQTPQGELTVEIPDDLDASDDPAPVSAHLPEPLISHRIQCMVAEIGAKMGFSIWIPRNDRERVKAANPKGPVGTSLIDILPMNYNDATIRTIEQIDVLWLRGRSIARAFEVEHTTAIYSGLLRMADLVALQPDIKMPLHIVAPAERYEIVLKQIKRPVFSLLETGPLSERCSLLTYDDIEGIASKPDLEHMRDTLLEDFSSFAR